MRLMDADALLGLIDDSQIEHFYGGVTIVHLSDLMKVIHNMPAVDAVPVVHGRWIDHKDEHQCSACKEFTVVDAYAWMQLQYDFCPHCGARMDGGDENERNTAARSIHVKGQSSDQRNHERTKEQNHEYR